MLTANIEVRKAETDQEIKSLYFLLKLLFEEIESPEDLLVKVRAAEKQGQEIYMGLVEGKVAACICTEFTHRSFLGMGAYIDGLVIDPAYRNTGILDEVIRYMSLHGSAKQIKSSIFHREMSNTQLIRFAEKYGFRISSQSFSKSIPHPLAQPLKLRWGTKIQEVNTPKAILATAPFLGEGYVEVFNELEYVKNNMKSLDFHTHFLLLSRFGFKVGALCYKIVDDPFWGKIGYVVRVDAKNNPGRHHNLLELIAEAERLMILEGVHKIFLDTFKHQPHLELVYNEMGYEPYGYRYINTDLRWGHNAGL